MRTVAFACLFAIYAYVQPLAYRSSYSTLGARIRFARAFGPNTAIRIFYGAPRDLLTVGGYAAWRVAGSLAICAGAYGLLAAVAALRREEEAGRTEFLLTLPVGRAVLLRASMLAIAAGVGLLGIAEFLGSVAAGLPVVGSAYMACATSTVAVVFVGVGALVCQLVPTRRLALELGSGILGVSLVLRAVGDTAAGLSWLRWLTPLGWAENLNPFTGADPWVLLAPVVCSLALLAVSVRVARQRDIGTGLVAGHDRSAPSFALLSTVGAHALRERATTFAVWCGCTFTYGVVIGSLASSTGNGAISRPMRHEIARLGVGSISSPIGYLSLMLLFFLVVISVFGCTQLGALHREEAEARLDTLLALPVSRARWLGAQILITLAAITVLSLLSAIGAWLGVEAIGTHVPVLRMFGAGLNLVPVAFLFTGLAALAYAALPRAAAAISYGLLAAAFVWQLVGSLLRAPGWLVSATPFAHVGLLPAGHAEVIAAVVMLGIAALLACGAVAVFHQRDLLGA